ncbi:MAG: hypothetical protein KJ011_03220 [Burkholderiaceae bacterium]|nr:hypothetical protein [Burkholderiaceae bacterium]
MDLLNDQLLRSKQVAEILSIQSTALEQDRASATPRYPFIRLGPKTVRYSLRTLERVIAASTVGEVSA